MNSDMSPGKMMETWLNLITEVTRGSSDARETMRLITGTPMTPDEVLRLMTRFMPAGVAPTQARAFNESLEEYWKMMGVVPRYRYLELLERNEELRRQIEEADRTIQQLKPMSGSLMPQEDAQKVFDLWGSMFQETLKAQQEMLRSWAPSSQTQEQESSTSENLLDSKDKNKE